MNHTGKTFSLWSKFGALNSKPVFDAFQIGANRLGYRCIHNSASADVHVIWSVLLRGRMQGNLEIWNRAKQQNKNIIVLEVGAFVRGHTWKMAVNGITSSACYGSCDIDESRISKLNLSLKPWHHKHGSILIAGQHRNSMQWDTPMHMDMWLNNTIVEIRKYSNQSIIVRSHPRCPIDVKHLKHNKNITLQQPVKLKNTYDDYDFDLTNISTVINYSSNPGTLAAIAGVPIFVDKKSLAWPVSNTTFEHIEQPIQPDREEWLKKMSFTEWTIDEISTGYPLSRLISYL